jgi:16S rRNA (cytosine967-C5)-methyltransferase
LISAHLFFCDMMEKSNRYRNQIRSLESVFEFIHEKFLDGMPVDRELSAFFRKNRRFGSKDRRFISNVIFGFFRWYGWLRQIEPDRRSLALLLGYLLDGQLVDDRVVHWADSLVLQPGVQDISRFQNSISLQEKTDLISGVIGPVSISSLNPAFVAEWSIERMTCYQTRPPVWLRMEQTDARSFLATLDSRQIKYRRSDQYPKTLEILSPININEYKEFRQGWVEIQDISSQAVGLICDPAEEDNWWDVCAGSGGKSLHLSALMGLQGKVFATEINDSMLQKLKRRIRKNRRWSNIHPGKWDGLRLPDFSQRFDGVLIDTPCSCSGTWRRNPELRWRIKREQIVDYARVQLNLLQLCCSSVCENGVLVYATCSLFPEENERVIETFLQTHQEFSLERVKNPFTEEYSESGLTVTPPEPDGNGMYIARMIKSG